MANSFKSADFLMESRLADAARGNVDAFYDLGVAYSTGSGGVDVDLIEAHKWFNLAALNGSEMAMLCRADISDAKLQMLSGRHAPGCAQQTNAARRNIRKHTIQKYSIC
jgi:TPR repeat protein